MNEVTGNRDSGRLLPVPALRKFFSLKWKALLFTSLVLITVAVTISLLSYLNLTNQFDNYRRAEHERYLRDMQVLIKQPLDNLSKFANIIPYLPGMQPALNSKSTDLIRDAFDPQWRVLQLDWGIDVLAFYDTSNHLLALWEASTWFQNMHQQALLWISNVNKEEKPVFALNCEPECLEYAAIPMLAIDGSSAGVVLVGASLADVVLNFKQISGNDVGLLVTGEQCGEHDRVVQWDACVVALTEKEQNLSVLDRAAAFSLKRALIGVRVALDGRNLDVKLVSIPEHSGTNEAYLVVIADITAKLADIRAATEQIFIVGGLGWLLAELLLLLILWTPMSRLRVTAGNLPLLAQSQFQTVRSAIHTSSRRPLWHDEIDILADTAVALANRLEQLEEEVEEHTRVLSQRMEELSQERDFVASLLNTAQVMIVTHDQMGRIVMVNPLVQTLTGYSEAELVGHDFVDVLFSQRKRDLRRGLKEKFQFQQRNHLRHESLVHCKDGSIRNITWYHSRLAGRSTNGPAILSVGLDITERRGAENRLAWMADHDSLTGLINRRRFQDELELVMEAAQRQHKNGALLLIDLDQFKYINDTSGHYNGDTLLKGVGNALSDDTIAADVVARLGGDEFAILLREADAATAIRVAEAVRASIDRVSVTVDGHTLRVSGSIGIVLFPKYADNVGDLMASADLAMYQAKEAGRGHWHMFSADDKTRERMRHRVYWRDKVSHALDQDKFILYFQPIMEIHSGKISHFEVLLRMRDDDGSIIGPVHFIDAAERGGMIHAVDRLVVSKATQLWAEITGKGMDIALSINLSGFAFSDPLLLPHIRTELARNRVDTSKIIFEITETAAVSDFAVANNLMLAVKELGCRFALDDFGIGFSSFYYLKHLPVDFLKIDGSFIRQLPDSLDDQIIVRAISQVASGFGKKIIAEFVETELTLELLRDYGIDYAQGYLISRPQSAERTFFTKR